MIPIRSNQEIGQYLRNLIYKKYKTQKKFCEKYVALSYPDYADCEKQVEQMQKNLGKILSGDNAIQISDLGYYCELLDITCDDIIFKENTRNIPDQFLSNKIVGTSSDMHLWETFLSCEDKTYLFPDEHGKSLLDYAFEHKNYNLIKYLMSINLISVGFNRTGNTGNTPDSYSVCSNIGCVSRNSQNRFVNPSDLRNDVISLALLDKDLDMLESLHAREIDLFYFFGLGNTMGDYEQYYSESIMDRILHSNKRIMDYYTEEFQIVNTRGEMQHFMFPFLSELINELLAKKLPLSQEINAVLTRSISHNKETLHRLTKLIDACAEGYPQFSRRNPVTKQLVAPTAKEIEEGVMRYFNFHEESGLICYSQIYENDRVLDKGKNLITNIVCVSGHSSNADTEALIQELNSLYDQIRTIRPTFALQED